MAPDDFDKIDDDEDFAHEFDFVEDDPSKGTTNSGSTMPPPKQPSDGGGNKPSPLLKVALVAITVVGLGFFAYSKFMGSDETQPVADQSAQPTTATNEQTQPLPDPMAPDASTTTAQTTPMPEPQSQDNVDFSEAFQNAENATATPGTNTPDKLSTAVPTKTFEQVQRELQGNRQPQSGQQTQPVQAVIPDSINATLDSLSEEMTMNVNQIKQLETTIANLATTVEQLNRTVSAMDNRILSLTEIADNLAQDLNNVKKVMIAEDLDLANPGTLKYTAKKQAHPIANNNITYTVHAIIPGRAWLKSSNGQIVTVTEGDKVGEFGTVAVIDATNGVVRTSSGITFR